MIQKLVCLALFLTTFKLGKNIIFFDLMKKYLNLFFLLKLVHKIVKNGTTFETALTPGPIVKTQAAEVNPRVRLI